MIKIGDKVEIVDAVELAWDNVVKNGDIYDVISVEITGTNEYEVGVFIDNREWTMIHEDINNKYVKVIPQQHTYESVFKDEVLKREFAVIPPHNIDK